MAAVRLPHVLRRRGSGSIWVNSVDETEDPGLPLRDRLGPARELPLQLGGRRQDASGQLPGLPPYVVLVPGVATAPKRIRPRGPSSYRDPAMVPTTYEKWRI